MGRLPGPASGRGNGRGVVADDERADHAGSYIGVGLLSLLLIAVAMAAFVLPPAFAAGFILKGRPALRVAGYALLCVWLAGMLLVGRRIMAPLPPDDDDPTANSSE